MQRRYRRRVRSPYRPYLMAIVLAFAVTMVVSPEVNEGTAMKPTLKDGQLMVVATESYSAKRGEPDLGKVVVLQKSLAPEVSKDNIIGRVAGLPGDTIEIKDGKVYRNGKEFRPQDNKVSAGKDQVIKVSKDDVFLLSDNRSSDVDSRNPKLKTVPMRKIKGNVAFKLWPLSDLGGV